MEISGKQIVVIPNTMVDCVNSGYSFLDGQKNPLFFWEPVLQPRKKTHHYILKYEGLVMMDQVAFSQLKMNLNEINLCNYYHEKTLRYYNE